jgi:hypothetical protein
MTREEWAKLTPEEKRIKVAGLRGDACLARDTKDGPLYYSGPDCLNDLNAMHHAVQDVFTTDEQWARYAGWLLEIAGGSKGGAFEATAAQRAEAFALVMTEQAAEVASDELAEVAPYLEGSSTDIADAALQQGEPLGG